VFHSRWSSNVPTDKKLILVR